MTYRRDNHRKLILQLSVLTVGISPLFALAGQPATQPAGDPPTLTPGQNDPKPERPPGAEELLGGRHPGQHGALLQFGKEATEAAMPMAMQFMRDNSPKRFAAMESLPETPRKNQIKIVATTAYLQLMKSKADEPKLFPVSLKRMKLEDEVFGLRSEVYRVPADKQESKKVELRSKVGELVNVLMEERQIRLTMLEETVKKEQTSLAADQSNLESLVDKRYTEILSEDKALGASFGGGRGNGPGTRNRGQRTPGEGTPPPQ